MKAQHFVHVCWQAPAFAFALLITFSACTKEDRNVIAPELDKVNDLIAYLHAGDHTLYVNPAYQQPVLNELQATEVRAGLFTLPASINGIQNTEFFFKIVSASSGNLVQIAQELDASSNLPDLVDDFHKDGVWYVVYKNAKCGEVERGFTTTCSNAANGTSTHDEWLPRSKCESGTTFCVEVHSVIGYRHVYELKDCKGIRQSSTAWKSTQCQG